ncbi:MAG: YcbK family protein [Steroidobacteraceae bacterium]
MASPTLITPLPLISRRGLLSAASAMLLLPFALRAQTTGTRSLSFVHTHTGETLSVNYWCDGAYQSDCLDKLNYFLRDFRSGDAMHMDKQLMDILYGLQVLADRDATYEVISAYRSPQTNAALVAKSSGVAKQSLHMVGKAIDVRITGFSTKKLQQLALMNQSGGVGYYAKSDFVHLDTGRVRSWVG